MPLADVTYLERVRGERSQGEPTLGQVRLELATERHANAALLSALMEMDTKLSTERSAGHAMLATVRELEGQLAKERETVERWTSLVAKAEAVLADNARDEQLRATESWWQRLLAR